jgi:hypothetical protein
MSPMTASIMSAVPPRRAGAGSAMNDATRELGAALGIAILGSVAASKYGNALAPFIRGLSPADGHTARSSIAGALQVANHLRGPGATVLNHGAKLAFIDGIHLACVVGAALAVLAAGIVLRYLPHQLGGEAVMHGAVESMENMAELGLAGVTPLVAQPRS